jgi:Rps23 Pro-64 3,4-dihydroxylase Tpa1-like proline 4-hydroxylase
MVYYPALEWNPEWEGGTAFYKKDENGEYDAIKYVSYKPNRLVLFPAKIPHRGMPVDRQCTAPRYVIAMKLQRDVNDPSYMREYYKKG